MIPDLVYMKKDNWAETSDRFDRWWNREKGLRLIVADVAVKAPSYSDIGDFSDYRMNLAKHREFFRLKSFYGDVFPDIGPYLGPGSLATFIGSEPIYSDSTIWFSESKKTLLEIREACERFILSGGKAEEPEFKWFRWTISSAEYYKSESGITFKPSMPDLQQNLDVLAAVMGPQRLLIELIDNSSEIRKTLDSLYKVWEMTFCKLSEIIKDENGYTAYTHYNLLGKGYTSVLQSDISCMLSEEMFMEFEMPYLKKQAEKLDNIVYHLDGPGAVRHLDALLQIDNISAVQWVPGAGQPGNADESYYDIYDKITKSGKGLYIYLNPWEIEGYIKRFKDCRLLIRTRVENKEEQQVLVEKFS